MELRQNPNPLPEKPNQKDERFDYLLVPSDKTGTLGGRVVEACYSRNMSSSVSIEVRATMTILTRFGVIFKGYGQIEDYLIKHNGLLCYVAIICEKISSEFKYKAQLLLTLRSYYDTEDQYLSLIVRSAQYEEDYLDELDKTIDKYDDAIGATTGDLLVNTDFRRI